MEKHYCEYCGNETIIVDANIKIETEYWETVDFEKMRYCEKCEKLLEIIDK